MLPDEEARAIPGRFLHLVRPGDWDKPEAYTESLAWWSDGGAEPLFEYADGPSGPPGATPAARRFADFMDLATTASDAVTAMQDASSSAMREEAGLFVATARKAAPVAALYHGLGVRGAELLPGWFGDFLLDADEVAAALPRAEQALDLSGARRSEVLARITDWMTVMGDAPDFDAAELVEGPLRVLRRAAAAKSGAGAFSRRH
ncbi:hypothetical protein [Streptomyces sp. NPDC047976]|uniref:hypothetical protein n=1 Tax=Streptomyces sp. NPDC047976 TaxID=3155746 RepID=UPI003428CF89